MARAPYKQRHRHLQYVASRPRALQGLAAAPRTTPLPPCLHRRNLRLTGEGLFSETHPTRTRPTPLARQHQTTCPRLGRHRAASAGHQLLQQLRSLSIPGSWSRSSSSKHSMAIQSPCTAKATTSATGCTSATADALYTVISKGTIGETYNIGGYNERTNLELANLVRCSTNSNRRRQTVRRADHLRHRPPGPRPALRDRRLQDQARARLD